MTADRAQTVPPDAAASNPGIHPPPVPQLPPSVAKHPMLWVAAFLISTAISTIGGVYAVQPEDNTAQIEAMGQRFDDRLDNLETALQRNEDRDGSRLDRLEEQVRDIRSYHEQRGLADTTMFRWQDRVINRIDRVEEKIK